MRLYRLEWRLMLYWMFWKGEKLWGGPEMRALHSLRDALLEALTTWSTQLTTWSTTWSATWSKHYLKRYLKHYLKHSLRDADAIEMTSASYCIANIRFSKVQVPEAVLTFIRDCTQSYGKVKLVLKVSHVPSNPEKQILSRIQSSIHPKHPASWYNSQECMDTRLDWGRCRESQGDAQEGRRCDCFGGGGER